MKRALIAFYGNRIAADPPVAAAAQFLLDSGWSVIGVQGGINSQAENEPVEGLVIHETNRPANGPREFGNAVEYWRFWRLLRRRIALDQPDVVLAIWLQSLGLLGISGGGKTVTAVAVLDVPPRGSSGRIQEMLVRRAWRLLRQADVVWASDEFKAALAQDFGRLDQVPLVCHNAPSIKYLEPPTWPRSSWLRDAFRSQGASIGDSGGCVLLRAGAVGERGGIEEAIRSMKRLPDDHCLVLMGRPTAAYGEKLRTMILELELGKRVMMLDRVADQLWKRSLQGADAGHLVHTPGEELSSQLLYQYNSSLSNNRLFQYMAAGLPIITYDDPRLTAIVSEAGCFEVVRLSQLERDTEIAWARLGRDPIHRKKLGDAGRKAHLARYNWDYQFKPVFEKIQGLMKQKQA
jgi:glycosyltransferase involved in cell wall biosynthesis